MNQHRNALPEGHQIHWYVVRKILGEGGFGITYLAEDTNLGRLVALKEYLPVDMAYRDETAFVRPLSGEAGEMFDWGLDRFISEAQTLARFKHPNIVHVFSVFRENNTAYMVMEYEQGRGLEQMLKGKKTLPEQELMNIITPLLDGLGQVHGFGFIHRDIKPANIYIREDGSPVLIDFGSARQSLGEQTRTLTAMVSPGYAPFEQYISKGEKQGPWTDIYGLGATLYRAVSGISPTNAMDRSDAILHNSKDIYIPVSEINPEGYSAALLAAIDKALAFLPEDRPQSINEWQEDLLCDHTAKPDEVVTEAATLVLDRAKDKTTSEKQTNTNTVKMTPSSTGTGASRWKGRVMVVMAVLVVLVLFSRINGPRQELPLPATVPSVPVTQEESDDEINLAEDELISIETIPDPPISIAPVTDAANINIDNRGIQNTDTVSGSPSSTPAPRRPAATDTIAASSDRQDKLIDSADLRRLELLRRRLQQNPRDATAIKNFRTILRQYEQQIRQAMQNRDYDRAEAYIEEMLTIAPDNQRLRDSLQKLQELDRRR
jgi:serine/threonine protein kinase